MFSFAGDTVLDPFVGTGTTSLAALNSGRNSIGVDIEWTDYERTAKEYAALLLRVSRLYDERFGG